MKRLIIFLMFLFSFGFLKANPIMPPPIISEFYLVNDSTWYLELVFTQLFYNDTSLNGYQITTSSGTVLFKNGIHIYPDSIVVITQDSLQNLLNINRAGDFIRIEKTGEYTLDELVFGNYPNATINSPFQNQSLVNHFYQCYDNFNMVTTHKFVLVKENMPSIGSNSFTASEYIGTFSGKVFDLLHNSISNIRIGYQPYFYGPSNICGIGVNGIVTDTSGTFSDSVKSGRHYIQIFTASDILADTIINIEPDSVNYFEFIIDTVLSNVTSNFVHRNFQLLSSPNPSNGKTTITVELFEIIHSTNARIKIYNSFGEMIRILPIDISSKQLKYSVEWDGNCYDNSEASGIYYYNLELDGKKVASNKLIITK